MIDDKKIEEAARHNADKYRYYSTLSDEDRDKVSIGSFMDCAKWMQEESLKNLWHPASEKPKEFNYYGFAALYILQHNHQIRMVLYDKDNMNWENVISNNEYWLYVDDLLPKKGGEK